MYGEASAFSQRLAGTEGLSLVCVANAETPGAAALELGNLTSREVLAGLAGELFWVPPKVKDDGRPVIDLVEDSEVESLSPTAST